MALHNMGVYGERELRGDRRRKGGRSLLAAAAASFFMVLGAAAPASSQAPSLHLRAGVTTSSALVRDLIATPQVRQLLGQRVEEDVQVTAAPGPAAGLVLRIPLRQRLALDAAVDWIMSELRATDGGGTRALQDLNVAQGSVAANWGLGRSVEVGAGIGVLTYITEDHGLFAEGGQLSPMIETRAAWTPPVWAGRVALTGSAQVHRFSTPAMRQAGGEDGMVSRFAIMARVRLLEVGR